jgi:N-acetylglucosaminyldiphosphoundecaprenol N-acetyl-beta-D-mannosaminyltransferase
MEFISGKVRTPPRWTGPAGLEWLFRLVDDPGRFWRRYLVEPWALVPLFAKDLWKHRLTRRY